MSKNPNPKCRYSAASHSKLMLLEHFILFKNIHKIGTNEAWSWWNYGFGGNERVNRTLSNWQQEIDINVACLTNDSIEFQARGAATGNVRSLCDEWWVELMSNIWTSTISKCERWYASVSAATWRESARYAEVCHITPIMKAMVYTKTHSQNWILSNNFNQWRSRSYNVTWSDLRAANTSRVAALRTDCRQLMWTTDISARA